MKVFISPEDNDIKYLDDLANDCTHYVSQLILEVFHGVSRNIGVKDPDKLASKPPERLQKGFLDGIREIGRKIRNYIGGGKKIRPFEIMGLKLYKKGRPLSEKEWEKFERQVVEYLRPYLKDLNEEMAIKGIILGMASKEAEDQLKQIHEYGKKSLDQIERENFHGYIPDNMISALGRLKINRDIQKAYIMAYDRAAMYVRRVNDDVRDAIRQQVITAHKLGKTPQQLASDLYWMKDEVPEMKKYTAHSLLRDWQRVAVTELGFIHGMGKMAANEEQARQSMKKPELAIYYVFTRGTCPWCQDHQGRIVRHIPLDMVGNEADDSLSSRGIEDHYTDTAVWIGKNNIGFKQSQWRVCVPAHPWNTANLGRIHPEAQEYDVKTHRIKFRGTKDFEKYIPEEFNKELEEVRKKNLERKERMEADTAAGIHKKPIEYGDWEEGARAGEDRKGYPIVESGGQEYIGVSTDDFNEYLQEWRKDRSRPIPISTKQREYNQLFGG